MNKETILISVLIAAGLALLGWAGVSGWRAGAAPEHTPQQYSEAVDAELPDKCTTPEGYSDSEWQEHMSHHPERYRECFAGGTPAPTYKTVSVANLQRMLEVKNFTLIDVHTPKQSHIPGTDAAIPYDEIARSDRLPTDKNEPVVLYCRSGSMSQRAAQTLLDMGYANVYHVDGGTNAWSAAGYALTDSL